MNTLIETLLLTYQLPAIFLGAFFFGETVILTASFLSGQGIWSLSNVFLLSLTGTIISDGIWFLFGQAIFRLTHKWSNSQKKYHQLIIKLDKITGQKPFLSLLFIKFLYGTRILTILYLSIRKIGFWTFVIFDTIGTIFWLAVMISIGWLAGKGMSNFIPFVQKTEYALLVIALLIIIFKLTTSWIEKKIIKK